MTKVLNLGRRPCDNGSKDLSAEAMNQGMSATTSSCKSQGMDSTLKHPPKKPALLFIAL